VSFAAITLCVASRRVFIVVSVCSVMTQSGNFWIYPGMQPYGKGKGKSHAMKAYWGVEV
jgi:hypothetical protein